MVVGSVFNEALDRAILRCSGSVLKKGLDSGVSRVISSWVVCLVARFSEARRCEPVEANPGCKRSFVLIDRFHE